jgi:hypothetical protein
MLWSLEMSEIMPFSKGSNGEDRRDDRGRFIVGHKGGPGSPVAAHARELHQRLTDALHDRATPERLATVIDVLFSLAETGDVAAARLLLERISPMDQQVALRISRIETLLGEDDND